MTLKYKTFTPANAVQAQRFKLAADRAYFEDEWTARGLPFGSSLDVRNGVPVVPPITTEYVSLRDLAANGFAVECDDRVQAMHGRTVPIATRSTTGNIAITSANILLVANTTGLVAGLRNNGMAQFPANATILTVSGSTVTMSAAATASRNGAPVSFVDNQAIVSNDAVEFSALPQGTRDALVPPDPRDSVSRELPNVHPRFKADDGSLTVPEELPIPPPEELGLRWPTKAAMLLVALAGVIATVLRYC